MIKFLGAMIAGKCGLAKQLGGGLKMTERSWKPRDGKSRKTILHRRDLKS